MTRDNDPFRDLDIDLRLGDGDDDDDPNDPSHRDHDLSESAPEWWIEPRKRRPLFGQRWALLLIAMIAIAGLILPYLLTIF